ncbi:MAG: hypothetical protein PHH37_10835 [Paludibacter sp.]|nr:hypothetical protein [Paludibacter sp.]
MKKNTKISNESPERNSFLEWVNSITVGDYKRIKGQIIDQCKISDQIFRHWKCGNTKIPFWAQPIINKIAGKDIFNP